MLASDPTSEVLESGVLTNLVHCSFALTPRTPNTRGPGNGLSVLAIMPVVHGTRVTICLSANVPTKDFTMLVAVSEVACEIIGETCAALKPAYPVNDVTHARPVPLPSFVPLAKLEAGHDAQQV